MRTRSIRFTGVPFFKRTRTTQIEPIRHRCRSVEGRKMFRPYRAGSVEGRKMFRPYRELCLCLSVESVSSVFHSSREHGRHRLNGFCTDVGVWRGRKMFRPYRAGSESCFRVYRLNPSHQCSIFRERGLNGLSRFYTDFLKE